MTGECMTEVYTISPTSFKFHASRICLIGMMPSQLTFYQTQLSKIPARSKDFVHKSIEPARCELGAHCHPWKHNPALCWEECWRKYADPSAGGMVGQKLTTLHNMIWDPIWKEGKAFRPAGMLWPLSKHDPLGADQILVDFRSLPCRTGHHMEARFFQRPNWAIPLPASIILEKDPHGELLEVLRKYRFSARR
jgi:hypothetical protein